MNVKYFFYGLLFFLLSSCFQGEAQKAGDDKGSKQVPPVTGTPLLWGYDDAADIRLGYNVLGDIIDDFGFDMAVHHYTDVGNLADLQAIGNFYAARNMKLIINLESANNDGSSVIDANGFDWFNHADGTHYFMFPEAGLNILYAMPSGTGVMYDEPGHLQNRPSMDRPYFMKPSDAPDLASASAVFTEKVRQIADIYKEYCIEVYTEHVFPIQFHTFAKAGFTPVPKMLKENWMPAYLAIALGASMQYGTPFWASPDLWFLDRFPGHNAARYKSALLMSYHLGADAIYTENLYYDGYGSGKGEGALVLLRNNNTAYTITDLGAVNKWFRWEYVPQNPRNYRHQDLKPRVAIIRQEDACWGQRRSWLPDRLFGVEEWKSNDTTEAWLKIWNLLSNGRINEASVSWHNGDVSSTTPYTVFAPLDGVVVFDETVGADCLKDVELIFLTGIGVSDKTLHAVKNKVNRGAVCVTLPGLAPAEIYQEVGNNGVLPCGEGKWVVTTSFLSDQVKENVSPFLPKEDYMRYRFGNTEVEIRPACDDDIFVRVKNID